MIRPSFLLILFCLFSFHTFGQENRPNIILIIVDDLGWGDVGFNGNQEVHTPNLDMLANKGIKFNRFYSASAVCSPTRASVLTGRNPIRIDIPQANSGHMKIQENTLAEILLANDYSTGHFGKWHLGTFTKTELDANRGGRPEFSQDYSIPSMHGYQEYFATESKIPTYDPMIQPKEFEEGESLRFGWKAIENTRESTSYGTAYWEKEGEKAKVNLEGENTRVILDRALDFITESVNKYKPFFTTIWPHTPHLPVVADENHRNLYADLDFEKQLYYGAITAMDEQIGRLWDQLGELGVQENTMIWFCSDNGPELNTPGTAGHFRGKKRSLYEGGVRVPAFMVWEKNIKGGRMTDFPAITSDYFPTVLDILNLKIPDRILDGKSLKAAISTETSKRNQPIGFLISKQQSWVDDRYKLITQDLGETFELFDLDSDPSESKNIINQHPDIANRMKKELADWILSVKKSREGGDY